MFDDTNPRPGDTEPELLRKILTLLGGRFSPGDTTEKITAKILLALQAGLAGGTPVTQNYVDTGDAAALAAAKTYSDSGDATTLAASKAYTDTSVRTSLVTLNAFVGNGGLLLTTGISETSVGIGALRQVTSGTGNSAFGQNALQQTTTGTDNNGFGVSALKLNTTGTTNTAFGTSALIANTSGAKNIGIGMGAVSANTTGSKNIGIGENSLLDLNIVANDGSGNNIAIGFNTGRGIVTGINNVVLGGNVTGLAAALSNNIILADGAGNIRLQFDNTGFASFSDGISYKMPILPETANYPIVAADTGKVLTNTGAGGIVTFTLPASAIGLHYFFSTEVAQTFTIKAVGADVIQIAGAVSSAAGTATNATVGNTLHLICSKAGKWVSFAREGTWTLT